MLATLTALSLSMTPTLEDYELPEDRSAVVLSLDYQGGFAPPRRAQGPYVEVLADGTLRVPDRTGAGRDGKELLTPEELQELLRFAIETHRIVEFDAERAREELSRAGDLPQIADAPDTVVALALPRHRVVARFNGLEFFATEAPQVTDLARLYAVSQKLRWWMHVVQAGGRERVRELAKIASEHLARAAPEAAPLAIDELSSVLVHEGSSTVYFERNAQGVRTRVVLEVPAQGEVEVSVQIE